MYETPRYLDPSNDFIHDLHSLVLFLHLADLEGLRFGCDETVDWDEEDHSEKSSQDAGAKLEP